MSTRARAVRGVYVTATPCEHHTEVRIRAAGYAQRHDRGAQCRACGTRWRLVIVGDAELVHWTAIDP